jgi:ribosome-binding factor A
MAAEQGIRARRVAEGIREELSSLLEFEVKDPRASGAVVTRVEMNADLQSGRVFVRLLAGGDTEAQKRLVEALDHASGMLRREVTRRLRLRRAPELRFAYDDGQDNVSRVEAILAEIQADKEKSGRR